ncbi:DUF883 family protein [Herminiimonas aquatilis]|uniref:YqjD family protein n=1 Tax=Herminiimonas aquatilis TaxID=345342 RepID=A0ABW2J8H8_9BURK
MAESRIEAVTGDLKTLSQDTKKMVQEAQEDAMRKTGELSEKCMELFNSAIATAKEVPTVAAAKTKEVAASTDNYVHQNPWKAVTLSAGVGLLLGIIFAKKK